MLGHVLREIAKKFRSRPLDVTVAPPQSHDELLQRAVEFQNAGDVEKAITCLREIIGKYSGHAQALCRLGTLLAARGELEAAQQLIERSVAADPSLAMAQVALGNLHQIKKDYMSAEACYRRALVHEPEHSLALCNLGLSLIQQQRVPEAETVLRKCVAVAPTFADSHHNLGLALRAIGVFDEAITCFRTALTLQPTMLSALANYVSLLEQAEDYDSALAVTTDVLARFPSWPEAHAIHAHVLQKAGRLRDALNHYAIAFRTLVVDGEPDDSDAVFTLQPTMLTALRSYVALLVQTDNYEAALAVTTAAVIKLPTLPEAFAVHGLALHKTGRVHEALNYYERVLLSRLADPELIANYGMALQDLGRLAETKSCYDRALEIDPDFYPALWQRALLLLLLGDFAAGWQDYHLRSKSDQVKTRHIPFPRWNGEPNADATVLIYAEQGLGDEIMFASCVSDVAARVGKVIVECNEKLAPIFRRSFASATVIGAPQDSHPTWLESLPKVDYAIAAGSLPQLFRSSLKDFGGGVAYLRADPDSVRYWRDWLATLGPGLKVGISWQGGSRSSRRDLRSISLAQWLPIFQQPGVQFVNLQYTPCQEQLQQLHSQHGISIHHRQDAIDNYDETAALVSALDLVISVQTAVIHLSGALGTPTWVMVPVCPEWRYGATGERMPWYGSVRLFRQRQWNDWQETIETVARELARRAT